MGRKRNWLKLQIRQTHMIKIQINRIGIFWSKLENFNIKLTHDQMGK